MELEIIFCTIATTLLTNRLHIEALARPYKPVDKQNYHQEIKWRRESVLQRATILRSKVSPWG